MNRSRRRSNSLSSIRSLRQRGASAHPASPPVPRPARPWRGRSDADRAPRRRGYRNPWSKRRSRGRIRNEQPVQGGDEDGALDRELEPALLHQIIEDRANPQPLPDSAEQQRSADPLGGDRQRALGILVERIDQQHLIGELGARGKERSERAGGGQLVGAAEIGDHPLAHGRAVAPVLDDLHVAAPAGPLEAEEHGPSLSSTTKSNSPPNIKRKYCANVALHFGKTHHRPQ